MIEGIAKREQKKDVSFCHSVRSYFLEVVSTSRSRAIGGKEVGKARGGQEKKRKEKKV
jgi:hypothetical protein